MTLTIKNADNLLLEAIEKIVALSPNSYEISTANEQHSAYAKEVQKIIDQVESGEMETYTLEEFDKKMDAFKDSLKAEYADN